MKKVVLAAAFTGNSSLKNAVLVNTVSFADLPDKPVLQNNKAKAARTAKVKLVASECTGQVKHLKDCLVLVLP